MPYRHQSRTGPVDEQAILRHARRQQGNVTLEQLTRAGLGRAAITYRCRRQRLFPVHRGVYGVGRPATTPLERAAAAVLACGEGAVLSHESALSLWGFTSSWGFPVHVTCSRRRERPKIITHICRGLTRADIRIELGVPTTSPARALLDSAPNLPPKRLARYLADGRRRGLVKPDSLASVLARFTNHPGRAPILTALEGSPGLGRSDFEDLFPRFCRDHGLPEPEINAPVAGRERDAYFAEAKLIVELDGWDFHRDRYAFEDDRERDAAALEAGLATYRLTWERFLGQPATEADRLATIIARRLT
jgi:hypothetical protein